LGFTSGNNTNWYKILWINNRLIWTKYQCIFNKFIVTMYQYVSNLGEMMNFIVKFPIFGVDNGCNLERDAQINSHKVMFGHGKLYLELPWWIKNERTFLVEKYFFSKIMKISKYYTFFYNFWKFHTDDYIKSTYDIDLKVSWWKK